MSCVEEQGPGCDASGQSQPGILSPSIHKEQRLTWRLIGSPAVEYAMGTTRPGIPVKLPSCMNLGGKSCHQYSWGQQQIHPFLVKAAMINLSHLTVWSSSPAVPKLVSVVQVALSLPYGPDYEGHIAVPSQEVRFINSWGSARNSCGGITKWLNLKGTSEVILSNLAQECSASAGCPRPCPNSFWILPGMKIPQALWATWCSAMDTTNKSRNKQQSF